MNKEDVTIVAQILTSMKDAARKLGGALEREDIAEANTAKKEILKLKDELDKRL